MNATSGCALQEHDGRVLDGLIDEDLEREREPASQSTPHRMMRLVRPPEDLRAVLQAVEAQM